MVLECQQQVHGALEKCPAEKKLSLLHLQLLLPVLCSSFPRQEPVWASRVPLGYANNSSKAEGHVPAKA